jgi:hypothetical protein
VHSLIVARDRDVLVLPWNPVLESSLDCDAILAKLQLVTIVESRRLALDGDVEPGVLTWPLIRNTIPRRSSAYLKSRTQGNRRHRPDCPEQLSSAKNGHADIGGGRPYQLDSISSAQAFNQRAIEFDSRRADFGALVVGGLKNQPAAGDLSDRLEPYETIRAQAVEPISPRGDSFPKLPRCARLDPGSSLRPGLIFQRPLTRVRTRLRIRNYSRVVERSAKRHRHGSLVLHTVS